MDTNGQRIRGLWREDMTVAKADSCTLDELEYVNKSLLHY